MNHSTTASTVTRGIRLSAVAALLTLLAGLLAVTQPVRANTYVVTNIANSGPGSLRQAITNANNNSGPDTITFAAAINGIPIVLAGAAGEDANASGDLDILDSGDLTIQGNGAANTIIDGGGIDRLFHICPGGGCANSVTFNGVTIRNGSTGGHGGGIYNKGDTTVDGSTVSANTAAYCGGGIFNMATLSIQNGSTIGGAGAGNTATVDGGGIYNYIGGTTTVDGSAVSANTATNGGGIYNRATLNVQNSSTIGGAGAGNTASLFGGGIYNETGTTTVDSSTVSANTAAHGGGIDNQSTLKVQNGSTIGGAGAGNTAIEGGGINNQTGATTTVTSSTVSANTAGWGGGIFNQATLIVENSTIGEAGAGNTATTSGGGIYNLTGITTLDGSTVSANTAANGGGIYNETGAAIVDGSIVSANMATNGGGIYNKATPLNVQNGSTIGGAGAGNTATMNGGGIYNEQGIATVDGSTVSANTATGTWSEGGGIYNEATLKVQNGSTIGGAGAGNAADYRGGGICNFIGGTTLVDGSTVSANSSYGGGGIYNQGTLTVQNGSTIGGAGAGNTATMYGGGIYNSSGGAATVTGSRILMNTASDGGGVGSNSNSVGATNVTGSCIVRNSATSFLNNQPAQQIATGNWWGAATGPNTPGADTVGGNVLTSGYLTAPPISGCVFHDVYLPLVLKQTP